MASRDDRIQALTEAAAERILVFDGPQGTYLQGCDLTAADFGGPQYEGCPEQLAITRPDVITDMYDGYLEAGADLIETNTFGGMSIVLAEYGLEARVPEITAAAVRMANESAARYSTASKPRWVVGTMGPSTKAISITGGITFDELIATYGELARELAHNGVDALLL